MKFTSVQIKMKQVSYKLKYMNWKMKIFFIALQHAYVFIYLANKCLYVNNCWHFTIYEQDKFHAWTITLSLA